MTYIVTYDIEEDRIRNRIAKFLLGHGCRLQKSVFAVEIPRHGLKGFLGRLRHVAGNETEIAVFRLCSGCRDAAINLGEASPGFFVC